MVAAWSSFQGTDVWGRAGGQAGTLMVHNDEGSGLLAVPGVFFKREEKKRVGRCQTRDSLEAQPCLENQKKYPLGLRPPL